MDNYRGFDSTLVTLKDVNFLVGENSSGKSTVISLLKTLLANQFWGDVNLNCIKEEINTFDELVNQYSDSRDFFTVGVAERGKKSFFIILKYMKGEDGLPKLCSYKSYIDGWSVSVSLYPQPQCNVKKEETPELQTWIKCEEGYKLNEDLNHLVSIPLPFIIRLNMMHYKLYSDRDVENISQIVVPSNNKASWIAPIRAKAMSLYSAVSRKHSEDGTHIPVVIKNNVDNELLQRKLKEFGRKSSLFDDIEIDSYGSDHNNAPFSIKAVYNRVKTNISEVGQGVSQLLPIFVECYMRKNALISIQQPEVHLHPKAQAAFGEVLYEVSRAPYNNQILIETHSDYTIDRYRYLINRKGARKKSTQILFFVRTKTGHAIKTIEIGEKGNFPEKMPKEYGKFFIDEELRMLSV